MALVREMSEEERVRLIGRMVYETLARDAAMREQLLMNRMPGEESDVQTALGSQSLTDVDRFLSSIGSQGSAAPVTMDSTSSTVPHSDVPSASPDHTVQDQVRGTQIDASNVGEKAASTITARDANVPPHFKVRSPERDRKMAKAAECLLIYDSVPDHLD